MYVGRPRGAVADEEAQNVVGIVAVHEAAHEEVPARQPQTLRTVGCFDERVEIVAQRGSDQLVGIDHQNPLERGRLYGERARRLRAHAVALGERHDAASPAMGDLHRGVGALHVAYHHLVKSAYGVKRAGKVFLGIVCVDDNRDSFHF